MMAFMGFTPVQIRCHGQMTDKAAGFGEWGWGMGDEELFCLGDPGGKPRHDLISAICQLPTVNYFPYLCRPFY
jgi:hypothetical protein